nr:MAG TPA: hypothetical protein [Caudoviricetes sp.]
MTYKRYWERNGTRRPFSPLYEAMKAYGDVMYKVPEYVEPKHCKRHGKEKHEFREKTQT